MLIYLVKQISRGKTMKKRMLIVISDDQVRKLLLKVLSDNFLINAIPDASGVAIHCKTQDYHVLLIDNNRHQTPTGIELIPEIRTLRPNIKIILMAGEGISEKEALDAGADAFLSKPLVLKDVEEVTNSFAF